MVTYSTGSNEKLGLAHKRSGQMDWKGWVPRTLSLMFMLND